MRDSFLPLFVVFSITMQFHMLTGPGTSIFRGMGRVYEEFNYSIPNLLVVAIYVVERLSPLITAGALTGVGLP